MIPRKIRWPQFFLDANRVNARCKLSAMNQLEKWEANGVISLRFPEHAQSEAESGSDMRRIRKARRYLIPFSSITTRDERKLLSEIEGIIFGNTQLSKQDKNDALIVFTAKKYSAILVTDDRKLLQAVVQLRGQVGVDVMTDKNGVKEVRQMISERDQMARSHAARGGGPLPDWVGRD